MLSVSESESMLLKELLLSSSAKDGAGRRSKAKADTSVLDCNTGADCWGAGDSTALPAWDNDRVSQSLPHGEYTELIVVYSLKLMLGPTVHQYEKSKVSNFSNKHYLLVAYGRTSRRPLLQTQGTQQGFSSGPQPQGEPSSVS